MDLGSKSWFWIHEGGFLVARVLRHPVEEGHGGVFEEETSVGFPWLGSMQGGHVFGCLLCDYILFLVRLFIRTTCIFICITYIGTTCILLYDLYLYNCIY